MFDAVHENHTCPLDGRIVVRLRANPTAQQKNDFALGGLGGCDACPPAAEGEERRYCPACAAKRARWERAWPAIYGETRVAGLDFANGAAALATITSGDVPDELVAWLLWLPGAVWSERLTRLEKNLPGSSATGS